MTKSMYLIFGFLAYLIFITQGHEIESKFKSPRLPKGHLRESAIFEEEKVRSNYSYKDIECVARNVFFEAGTEEILGKIAVAQVTLNRLRTGFWGQHLCDVVYAPEQFSWTKDIEKVTAEIKGVNWKDSMLAARTVLENGARIRQLKHALFYHADYVNPNWSDPKNRIGQIGTHVYYERAKGSWLEL